MKFAQPHEKREFPMSNAMLKVIAALAPGLCLIAPLAHAQDFDGAGEGGDMALPPPTDL